MPLLWVFIAALVAVCLAAYFEHKGQELAKWTVLISAIIGALIVGLTLGDSP
jgi:uncharacterized membrane protein YeaQ/YmgE (transglycosylase-associated protein family)